MVEKPIETMLVIKLNISITWTKLFSVQLVLSTVILNVWKKYCQYFLLFKIKTDLFNPQRDAQKLEGSP